MDSKQDGHRTPRACGWSPSGTAGTLAPREGFLVAAKSISASLPTDTWLPVQSPGYKEPKS